MKTAVIERNAYTHHQHQFQPRFLDYAPHQDSYPSYAGIVQKPRERLKDLTDIYVKAFLIL